MKKGCGLCKRYGRGCQYHPDETPSKGGRPTKYDPAFPERAYEQALLGATDENLADYFGIGTTTLYEWKNRYPEFAEAIKQGKAPADGNVVAALYGRATGAEWVEEQAIKLRRVEYKDGKRVLEEERVEVVEVTRRAPPDTTAGIFWLKNRQPGQWRDRRQHEHSGPGGGPIRTQEDSVDLSLLSDQTLRAVREELRQAEGGDVAA